VIKETKLGPTAWYVFNFYTIPEARHSGLSSATFRPMLDHFDANNEQCYLETHKSENVGMYEHFGFAVVKESKIPGSDFDFYAMLREPQ
jgi:ribosomal protein S18 acetylase RimI-like enzyme